MPRKHPIMLRTIIGASLDIDREAGVIKGVAVITGGVTKVSANGQQFDVDAIALQQVADAINASEVGVKSRMTHPEIEGGDELPMRLGYIRNARVDGNIVRADMHFHNATSSEAITLMSIAETDPGSCGLSIVDNDATLEQVAGTETGIALRVDRIDAVDWVGEPAANPAGLLSARTTILLLGAMTMTDDQKSYLHAQGLPYDASDEQTAAFIEALSDDQKAQFAALKDSPVVEAAADAAEGAGAATDEPVAASTGEEEEEKPTPVAASAQTTAKPDAVALAAARAERGRVLEIQAIALKCGHDNQWTKKHIDEGTDIGEVRRIALANIKREPNDMPTSTVKVGADLNRDSLNQAVQDAIMLRAGVRQLVKTDESGVIMLSADRRPQVRDAHERANDFRGRTIVEMGRCVLLSLGYHQADRMSRPALASLLMNKSRLRDVLGGVFLAQSTGDFPFLLADTMGKVLRAEYALAPHTWNLWCRRHTAPDFKEIKAIQLSEAADLEVIPEGDEYTYASLTEGQEKYALQTHGKGLKFTRQSLINDDLDAFNRVPRKLGTAAMRAVETEAVSILTANANLADGQPLFSTAHTNLSTGALTVASLGIARALMRRQTALGSSDPLELTPQYLMVPETIYTTAAQLVSSTVDPAKQNATPNPFANQLQVIPSARLDLDNTAQWYLLADTNQIDTVEMAFLEGEEAPVVEEEDEFDTDARKLKVRHTFRAKAIDFRGMVRSSGA
jgi:hypothetical protein